MLNEKLNATDKHLLIFFWYLWASEENPWTAVPRPTATPDDQWRQYRLSLAAIRLTLIIVTGVAAKMKFVSMPVFHSRYRNQRVLFVNYPTRHLRPSDNDVHQIHHVLNQRRMTMNGNSSSTPKPEWVWLVKSRTLGFLLIGSSWLWLYAIVLLFLLKRDLTPR